MSKTIDTSEYPIQLNFVGVREITAKTYRPLDVDYRVPADDVHISSMKTAYDDSTHTLQVNIRVVIGDEEEPSEKRADELAKPDQLGLRLKVHLVGVFHVDAERFPMDRLDEWANFNAPMTLYPYAREHVFALSARCGIRPVILPLLTLPTIKIAAVSGEKKKPGVRIKKKFRTKG